MSRHQQTHLSEDVRTAVESSLGPQRAFPRQSTVLDLFCEQREKAPDRPAIRYRDMTMSYAALDSAADATADRLVENGVPARHLIPVLIADGLEFPTALIAVMKTGSAFVPLDPAWPVDRIKAIMSELSPPVVVVSPATADTVAGLRSSVPAVIVDCVDPPPDPAAAQPPPTGRGPGPEDLIYGFYTSGSTGTPKCALNHHRGLVNRLTAMSRRFGDGAGHVTLQNSRSTFDSSMWQVLWPLTSGGQVVLPDRDGILDLEETAMTIGHHGVTITDFVPSVLAAFVSLLEEREDLRTAVSSLRRMLIGGEAAGPGVVHRLRALLPGLEVTNTFGPTECSIGSVFHDVTDADADRIPLGRPIDNTAAIVLDDDLRPLPRNTPGELYLGGECVGAGYLNDPGRTARVFVPNPFPEIPGPRLYRTGDLARVGEDGLLHFMGRRDEQVKLGGVRVELGDVASALADHPLVGNAAAVVLGEAPEATLAGCVTPRSPDETPSVEELREHAAEKLPAEQVPNQIVVLDELPLNHNGKADRRALAALVAAETAREGPDEPIEPPADPMEELVCSAWREVLEREQVSVVVPFSDYGGTSLSAYRLTTAVGERLGRPVRPRDLLVESTVRAQAARLAKGVDDDSAELAYIRHDLAWRPPRTLLLTGATGFIGAHILAELLTHSNVELICLVRAGDPSDGARRLTEVLDRYGLTSAWQQLPTAIKAGRVEVVPGDLGSELLGLPRQRFDAIASAVSGVVNAAGAVNFLSGYLDHRPANVLGVQELVKLASGGARLHALSTLSIFAPAGPDAPRFTEDRIPAPDQIAEDGYNRSKYVAESLLADARRQGVGSVVYRLGEVWPHRATGVANPDSLAHNLLYACARTGCVFPTEAATDVTPVDVVGRFVAGAAIGDIEVPDGAVHTLWPASLRFADAFDALAGRCGLERVGYARFRERLETAADSDDRLAGLRLLLPPPAPGRDAAPVEFDRMFTDGSRRFDTRRFGRYAGSLARPAEDGLTALDRYLTRLTDISAFVPQER